jgi:excisionase family DNA binding protein
MTVERQTVRVEDAATILGISRNHAYELVKTGDLPVIKLGRRFVVPKAALQRMLEGSAPERRELMP